MIGLTARLTGRWLTINAAGEPFRAFVPAPLPPDPPVNLAPLLGLLGEADRAIGRLDGICSTLPDAELFLYMYVRKEAVLSSQIEGTQSSLSDLLLFENQQSPSVPLHDVSEVSRYVAAMDHGLKRLRRDGFPLSLRLIREMHEKLLEAGRGAQWTPGEFRTSQNWIGGTRPGNAAYVPPPPEYLNEQLGELENFLRADRPLLPTLVKAALAHVQFESIHPFLDGNGRMGRLLIPFLLCVNDVLKDPILYPSLYFKQHRERYYALLQEVRVHGDWESWVEFFLSGIRQTANPAVQAAREILDLLEQDAAKLAGLGRARLSAAQVHTALQRHPIFSIPLIAAEAQLSYPPVARAIEHMEMLGMVTRMKREHRPQLFTYDRYLAILSQGTEPLRARDRS